MKKMWGKRYNRGGDHGKPWHIWVSCSTANPFCLCTVSEVSRMCLCRQGWESVEAVDFPALSLKSRQIKPYLPLFSVLESCGAFPPVRRFAGRFRRSRVISRRSVGRRFSGASGRNCGQASEDGFSLLWEGQAERPAVRRPHPPTPKGCFGQWPVPASAQSPHRSKRPTEEGISNSASLRLLLPTKSFDFAGDPNITKGRLL